MEAFVANYRDRLQDARRAPDAPAHVYPAAAPPPPPPTAGRRRGRRGAARRPGGTRHELRQQPAARLRADADPDRHGLLILLPEAFASGQVALRPGLAGRSPAASPRWLAIVAGWDAAATPASHFDGMLTVDRMASTWTPPSSSPRC